MINLRKVSFLVIILLLVTWSLSSGNNPTPAPEISEISYSKNIKKQVKHKDSSANIQVVEELPSERYEIFSTGEEKGQILIDENLNGSGELSLYDEMSDSFVTHELAIREGKFIAKSPSVVIEGEVKKVSNILGFEFNGLQLDIKGLPRFFVPEGAVHTTFEHMITQQIEKNTDSENMQREREEEAFMNSSEPVDDFYPDDTEHEI